MKNSRITRIGLPIINGTNLYPMVKNHSTEIASVKNVKEDGFEVWNISFTSLDCTYIETVRHISTEGPLPMEIFAERPSDDLYRAIMVHLDTEPGGSISLSDLEPYLAKMRQGDALIVNANGYTEKCLAKEDMAIRSSEYNIKSPYFSDEAMRGIIDAGTAILAGNFPSFSKPNTEEGFGIDMIAEFYKEETNMILAPLVNMDKITETEVVLQINPIEIEGCCGLICNPAIFEGELKEHLLNHLRA